MRVHEEEAAEGEHNARVADEVRHEKEDILLRLGRQEALTFGCGLRNVVGGGHGVEIGETAGAGDGWC